MGLSSTKEENTKGNLKVKPEDSSKAKAKAEDNILPSLVPIIIDILTAPCSYCYGRGYITVKKNVPCRFCGAQGFIPESGIPVQCHYCHGRCFTVENVRQRCPTSCS